MFEIVEYKSKGHPDTLTDLIVEDCSSKLEELYSNHHGSIHYNVDKALFLAGDVEISIGKLNILKRPKFILGGQYSEISNIDIKEVLTKTISNKINKLLPNLKHFDVEILSGSVSKSLESLSEYTVCGDTSFGVGYFPYSEAESRVLEIKDELDSLIQNKQYPIGEDYKIMYTPKSITVSSPIYYNLIENTDDYCYIKNQLEDRLKIVFNPDFDVNKKNNPYLTYSGSSIECGDDGQVGRGNRYNGLITPCRPMTMEAYHGKNNINHVGKIYQKLAYDKAKYLWESTGKYSEVYLVSKIGRPLSDYEEYIKQC